MTALQSKKIIPSLVASALALHTLAACVASEASPIDQPNQDAADGSTTTTKVPASPIDQPNQDAGDGSTTTTVPEITPPPDRRDEVAAHCVPGQKRCSGNGVQTCNPSGQWDAAVACG